MTITTVPSLESLYFAGAFIQLYAHPPPAVPARKGCGYRRDEARMTQISDRFDTSLAERVLPPFSQPDVSITLDKRLVSSTRRVSHVWTARIQNSPSQHKYPSIVVAKMYDPVYADSDDAEWSNPFVVRDMVASCETASYQRLERLQGTEIPRFYGHFVALLPSQQGRTVNVILVEYIDGRDIRDIVPKEAAHRLCDPHHSALIEAVLRLHLTIQACGVFHLDMQPRNVIVRDNGRLHSPSCSTAACPFRFVADCKTMKLVMVDFEVVDFIEPENELWDPVILTTWVERLKPEYLENWLVNRML